MFSTFYWNGAQETCRESHREYHITQLLCWTGWPQNRIFEQLHCPKSLTNKLASGQTDHLLCGSWALVHSYGSSSGTDSVMVFLVAVLFSVSVRGMLFVLPLATCLLQCHLVLSFLLTCLSNLSTPSAPWWGTMARKRPLWCQEPRAVKSVPFYAQHLGKNVRFPVSIHPVTCVSWQLCQQFFAYVFNPLW